MIVSLPLKQASLLGMLSRAKPAGRVCFRQHDLKIVAGRAAKQKQEKRNAQSSQGITNREEQQTPSSQTSEEQNPLLPNDPVGSLSEFGVPSTSGRPDEQASNFVEEISSGPTAVTYAIWITLLLAAIGAFYGLVFAASGGLSAFLKDKVTFTRKDFVPYSERRKLEDNLKASNQERQEAERVESDTAESRPAGRSETSQGLYNLMPAPSLKK